MKKESIFSRNINLPKILMINLEPMSNKKKAHVGKLQSMRQEEGKGDWQLPSFMLVYPSQWCLSQPSRHPRGKTEEVATILFAR